MDFSYTIAQVDIEVQKYRSLIEQMEADMKVVRAENSAIKRLVAIKKRYADLTEEYNLLVGEHFTLRDMVNQ